MSTLQTINGSDLPTNSRADINGNFSALNADKLETSVLDTDTTLAANSNSKVPTQAAVKAYVDAGGNVNASTTGKGIVEEATQAEVDAGTAAGGTGARLFVNPSAMHTSVLTIVPEPLAKYAVISNTTFGDTTTAKVALFSIPRRIVVNKVSIRSVAHTTADTLDISLYSEDGQTQYFSVTTASIAAASTTYTTSVSSVALNPGNYYLLVNANSGTPNFQVAAYETNDVPFANTTTGTLNDVSSEPVLAGTLSITAGTPPATITPTSITPAVTSNTNGRAIVFRLDN